MQAQLEPGPAWTLVEELGCGDARRRMAAVRRLRGLGNSAAPALERGLSRHARANVRRWCAQLLADGGRRASACAIVTATHDRVAAVRLIALRVLADPLHGEEFDLDPVPHLVRLARNDRSKRVRLAALHALALRLPDARAMTTLAAVASDARTDAELHGACLAALREAALPAPPLAR